MHTLKALFLTAVMLWCAACGGQPVDADLKAAREQYSQGYYLQSETGYERYLQRNPQGEFRKEAWNRLLNIALNIKGDLERSVSLLEAMSLEESHDKLERWKIMYQLGDIYMQLGKRSKAVETLEKSLMLAEDMPEQTVKTQLRLARIYRLQGNYDLVMEALNNCAESAATNEDKATCLYELAQSYSLINNWGLVRKALEQLLALDNVDEERRAMATFLLAEAFEYAHDYDKVRSLLESIRETYPNPKVVEARLRALKGQK